MSNLNTRFSLDMWTCIKVLLKCDVSCTYVRMYGVCYNYQSKYMAAAGPYWMHLGVSLFTAQLNLCCLNTQWMVVFLFGMVFRMVIRKVHDINFFLRCSEHHAHGVKLLIQASLWVHASHLSPQPKGHKKSSGVFLIHSLCTRLVYM